MIVKAICVTSKTFKKCNEFLKTLESLKKDSILGDVNVDICDVSDDDTSIIMEKYNVSSLPSLILIGKDDAEMCKISGNVDKTVIEEIIKDIIDGKYNWSMR